jgi:hypothetical protein
MILNINYDSSVVGAPAGFKTALNYVVNYLDGTFTNNFTVNINVGWGEIAGQALDAGALGESMSNSGASYTYSQIVGALSNNVANRA